MFLSSPKSHVAFTLIELLIVVAIIAILAAIAVPNFLEAQVRAKVSRGQNDMRAIATALETYKIDTNLYPPDRQYYQGWLSPEGPQLDNQFADCVLGRLTTPIAYMTSLPKNVFQYERGWHDGDRQWYGYKSYNTWATIITNATATDPIYMEHANYNKQWVLISVGPDQTGSAGEYALFGEALISNLPPTTLTEAGNGPAIYDATNGTISVGDIVRTGP